jgi:L-ribulose-5-phosphate 3-epimerase UlaE
LPESVINACSLSNCYSLLFLLFSRQSYLFTGTEYSIFKDVILYITNFVYQSFKSEDFMDERVPVVIEMWQSFENENSLVAAPAAYINLQQPRGQILNWF